MSCSQTLRLPRGTGSLTAAAALPQREPRPLRRAGPALRARLILVPPCRRAAVRPCGRAGTESGLGCRRLPPPALRSRLRPLAPRDGTASAAATSNRVARGRTYHTLAPRAAPPSGASPYAPWWSPALHKPAATARGTASRSSGSSSSVVSSAPPDANRCRNSLKSCAHPSPTGRDRRRAVSRGTPRPSRSTDSTGSPVRSSRMASSTTGAAGGVAAAQLRRVVRHLTDPTSVGLLMPDGSARAALRQTETIHALAALGLRHRDFLDTVASTDPQFRQPSRLCPSPPSSRAGSSTASPWPFHVKHRRIAVIATGLGVAATDHDVGARETGPTVSTAPASCTGRLSDARCEARACAPDNSASRRRRVVTL